MASPPSGPPAGLPMDDKSKEIMIAGPVLTTVATIFVMFRLSISWKNKKFFLLTDYLLILGAILNMAAMIAAYKTALVGQGKHVWDPFITPVRLEAYLKYLWWSQILNIYAMAAVKGSICAYLFMLNFSKLFRILIWVSVVIHISTNFIYPSVILLGECRPISFHWNKNQHGSCWDATPRLVSGYLGAASNILTDLFYTSAPLVYISSIQLSRRTKWGVRMVFLLAFVTTTISALKLYEMRALNDSPDPTYTAVPLSIFSQTEVCAGMITSCLPPLRKTFENLLKRVLPESVVGSSKTKGNSYALPAYGSQLSRTGVKPNHDTDGESEEHILDPKSGGIVRTTQVSIYDHERRGYADDNFAVR